MSDDKKNKMLSALAETMKQEESLVPKQTSEIVKSVKPSDEKLIQGSEEDYEFTRSNVKKLIETSDEAIATMMNLATDSEHPRAFEVLANLIKTASDINQQLINLHKDRKKLIIGDRAKEVPVAGVTNNTTNNIVYTGSTDALQKYLKTRDAAKVVIDAEEV